MLTEQEIIRREKLKTLKDLGVDPFGSKFVKTHSTKEIKAKFDKYDHDQLEELNVHVIIAGRIIRKRGQGKAGFLVVQDKEDSLQVYVRKDEVGDNSFEVFEIGDLGDIIGVEGVLFRTKTNELTLKATKYTHLSKALRPLPDKWSGLQDKE